MKTFFSVVLAVVLLVSMAVAGTYHEKNSDAYWQGNIATAVTGTSSTTGTATSMYGPYRYITCSAAVSGGSSTAVHTFTVKGSIDGTNFNTVTSLGSIVTGNTVSTTSVADTGPFMYLRTDRAYSGRADSSTSYTVNCVAAH